MAGPADPAAQAHGDGARVSVLTGYLNRMFLVRFLVVLFGIIGFAAVVDLLDVAEELVQAPEGPMRAGLAYFALRLPIMLSEMMPIAALIAGLLAVADLLRHRELVVIWSSGVRPLTILRLLLPMGLALVAAKFAIDDVALPRAANALRLWGIGDYGHNPAEGQTGDHYWLRSGGDIVRLSANAIATGEISDVTIFRRGPDGILTERLEAERAITVPGGWRLEEVTRSRLADRQVETLPTLDWPVAIDVDRVRLLARPPRELGFLQLQEIATAGGYGLRAREPYVTWLHQRVAGAFVPMFLMMLAFALVQRFSRTASIAPVFMTAVGIGFTLIILGGVASALGEVGLIAPAFAAWAPTALLAALVLLLASRGSWAKPRARHAA
jgi:lipopolysaccharide export system permease protein